MSGTDAAMGKHKERLEKLLGELNKSGAALDEPLPDLDLDLGSDVSSFSDDDSDLDLDNLDRLASGGGSDSKLDAKVAARTAKLQERLAQLVEEVRRKDERAEERLRMKDAEFDRERGRMMDAVKLLKDKQAELERLAPPLREAIVSAKDELAVLTCSTERMQELTRRRQDDLSLPEFAMLRVHQETADLRQNLDVCRLERDALKDANARLDVDNKRMQRDLKRVTSSVDADARESSADREALSRRCDRLGRDLEDALVKVEVLSAKGAMYDEVAATVDRLTKRAAEAEKEAAGAVSETKILRQEKHTLVSQMESRRHQCELLTQDKAYLSREVDAARERERKWEEEEDRLREKARGLRHAQGRALREARHGPSGAHRQTRAKARVRDRAPADESRRRPLAASRGTRQREGPGDTRASRPARRRRRGRARRAPGSRRPPQGLRRSPDVAPSVAEKRRRFTRGTLRTTPDEVHGARARVHATRRGILRRQGAPHRVRDAHEEVQAARVAVPATRIQRRANANGERHVNRGDGGASVALRRTGARARRGRPAPGGG